MLLPPQAHVSVLSPWSKNNNYELQESEKDAYCN